MSPYNKSARVYIEGGVRNRKWQDKNGIDRYTTAAQADSMQMVDRCGSRKSSTKESINNNRAIGMENYPRGKAPPPSFEEAISFCIGESNYQPLSPSSHYNETQVYTSK